MTDDEAKMIFTKTVTTTNIPASIADVAQKWADALSAVHVAIQAGLSDEDVSMLVEIVLETAGAVFAPGELSRKEQKLIVAMFRDRLALTCAQFMQDRAEFIAASKNGMQ